MDTPTSDNPTENQVVDITNFINFSDKFSIDFLIETYSGSDSGVAYLDDGLYLSVETAEVWKYFTTDKGYKILVKYKLENSNVQASSIKEFFLLNKFIPIEFIVSKIEDDGSYKEYYECGDYGNGFEEGIPKTDIPPKVTIGKQYPAGDGVAEFYPPKVITYDRLKDNKGNNSFNTLIAKYIPNPSNSDYYSYYWLIEGFGPIAETNSNSYLNLDSSTGAHEAIYINGDNTLYYYSDFNLLDFKDDNGTLYKDYVINFIKNLSFPQVPAECKGLADYGTVQ
jgi:hypothetical protein